MKKDELRKAYYNDFIGILHPSESLFTFHKKNDNITLPDTNIHQFADLNTVLCKNFSHLKNCFFTLWGDFLYISNLVRLDVVNRIFGTNFPDESQFVFFSPKKIKNVELYTTICPLIFEFNHEKIYSKDYVIFDSKENTIELKEIDDLTQKNYKELKAKIQDVKNYTLKNLPSKYFPTFELNDTKRGIALEYAIEKKLISLLPRLSRKKIHNYFLEGEVTSFDNPDFQLQEFIKPQSKLFKSLSFMIDYQLTKKPNECFRIQNDIIHDATFQKLENIDNCVSVDFEWDVISRKIFMVGIYYRQKYTAFFAPIQNGDFDEEKLLKVWTNFLMKNPNLIYVYYSADLQEMKQWMKRCNYKNDIDTSNWIDLKRILESYVVFDNVYNSKLKSIHSCLCAHNLMSETYHEECTNGLEVVQYFHQYINGDKNVKSIIEHYNYMDVLIPIVIIKCILEKLKISMKITDK